MVCPKAVSLHCSPCHTSPTKQYFWCLLDISIEESIHKLCSYSLARCNERDPTIFSMHPVIHSWAQERCSPELRKHLSRQAFELLVQAHDRIGTRIWPHLFALLNTTERYLSTSASPSIYVLSPPVYHNATKFYYVNVLLELCEGRFFWVWGKVTDIKYHIRKAFSSKVESGSEKWRFVYRLSQNLPLSASLEGLRWTLLDVERKLPRKHPAVLNILGDLAWRLYLQNRFEESLAWYIWLQRVRKNVLGRTHPSTMGALKGIAHIYWKQERWEEAEEMFRTVYHEREKALGINDYLTMNAQDSLLDALEDRYKRKYDDVAQERQEVVIEFLRTVYHANKKFLGNDHVDTIKVALLLVKMFAHGKRNDKAFEWYKQAVKGRKSAKENAENFADIGFELLEAMNGGALMWFERAFAERENSLGVGHDDTIRIVYNIAEAYEDQANYDEALIWYNRALAGREKALGENHTDTLQIIYNIGIVYGNKADYDEALIWYNRALAGREKALGKNHSDTLHIIYNIGIAYHNKADYDEALIWYNRALAGREKALGENHTDTLQIIHQIGIVYHNKADYDEALRWYNRALTGREKDDEALEWDRRYPKLPEAAPKYETLHGVPETEKSCITTTIVSMS